MKWITDELQEYNSPVNLELVESVQLGTDCTITFKFQNSSPVIWRFSAQDSAVAMHKEITGKMGAL